MAATYLFKSAPSEQNLRKLRARYTELDLAATETYLVLLQVSGDIFSMMTQHLALKKTSPARLTLLIHLLLHGDEGVCPCDLADAIKVSRATITGLVDGLDRSGLIERRATPGDRRSIKIRLTSAGRRFLDSLMPERCRRIAALMGELNEKERKTLRDLLNKIARSKGFAELSKQSPA